MDWKQENSFRKLNTTQRKSTVGPLSGIPSSGYFKVRGQGFFVVAELWQEYIKVTYFNGGGEMISQVNYHCSSLKVMADF